MPKDSAEEAENQQNDTHDAVATAAPPKPTPARKPPKPLPPWKVILHNDDVNELGHVALTIETLTPLHAREALLRTIEADQRGSALLLSTHRERAELYREQFAGRSLTVTIEPA